jgi:hypothetical protein
LVITKDDRSLFKIETFGFIKGGVMDITISNFDVVTNSGADNDHKKNEDTKYKLGFVMRKSGSESEAQQDVESIIDKGLCIMDPPTMAPTSNLDATSNINSNQQLLSDIFIDLSSPTPESWKQTKFTYTVTNYIDAGLYSLLFARCLPMFSGTFVNFELSADFYNPGPYGPNYLSAGDVPLPIMYLCFFIAFSVALILWSAIVFKCCGDKGAVHKIHYLMTLLLVSKCFTLLFESIRYHYISLHGVSTESWSVLYYIFASLKAILLFTVILLIGSGWSLIKGYLNDKEKKIIFFVLILQVLNNIVYIILDETSPGSQVCLFVFFFFFFLSCHRACLKLFEINCFFILIDS